VTYAPSVHYAPAVYHAPVCAILWVPFVARTEDVFTHIFDCKNTPLRDTLFDRKHPRRQLFAQQRHTPDSESFPTVTLIKLFRIN
jgi:hypothetical protein